MSAPRVLVAYATHHGHTGRVAERVAATLRAEGADVTVARLDEGEEADPGAFDGIVVAASIHGERHQHEVVAWARRHSLLLSRRPSALLSVSLTAVEAPDDYEARRAVRRMIDDLLDDTGWMPAVTLPVAGALQYERYDLPTRVLMRLIARRHGAPDDVSRDVVFTDWEALDRFATAFAVRVAHAAAAHADREVHA